MTDLDGLDGPTSTDLAELSAEMPLIEAEVLLLDAQIAVLRLGLTDVTRQKVRRARRRVLREACALLAARAARPRRDAA
ncbi:DUF6284 family protein [Salinispora arenicola]|uniref:DUF6284 family protein n=1 Tax=Salinispora arenicola TaxID=168697 RepID=UPI0016B27766|nr:DUF6284 family protein [Salinispora arenicola]NIL56218.1 hypothetical protein [Salinispora arenicola]NIL62151.1 hypothetical protein [Salinispora arenicola]